MIEFHNVSFTYPNTSAGIKEVSLSVNTGEFVAILGKSGCGKTTMLKLLAGLERPNSGTIWINGINQVQRSCAERQLGIVFQDYALFPHYNVAQNIGYPLKIKKHAFAAQKVADIIEIVGLTGLEKQYPQQLSGGQQQRVALARALVFGPSALLLDEPLSALDASLRTEMRAEILKIQRQLNITTFLITHDQEEAMSMADKVAVMSNGQLLQCDTPERLYRQPASLDVARFIGKANLLTGKVVGPQSVHTDIGLIQTQSHPYQSGDEVTLVIRPEQVRQATSTNTINRFVIDQILEKRFLGATTEYTTRIGSQTLLFDIPHLEDTLEEILIPQQTIHVLRGVSP